MGRRGGKKNSLPMPDDFEEFVQNTAPTDIDDDSSSESGGLDVDLKGTCRRLGAQTRIATQAMQQAEEGASESSFSAVGAATNNPFTQTQANPFVCGKKESHLDKTARHAENPKGDTESRRGPKKKLHKACDSDDDDEQGEELVPLLEKKNVSWDAKAAAAAAEELTLSELRTLPAANSKETGQYKTAMATWSDKMIKKWEKKKVYLKIMEVIASLSYWEEQEFALLVAEEWSKKDKQPHFHIVLHFFEKHRMWWQIQVAFDKKLWKLQFDIILPGHGVNSLVPPLTYLCVYDGNKLLDPKPMKSPNMKIPSQVRVAATSAYHKMQKRPLTDHEAENFLIEQKQLLVNKTRAELQNAVRKKIADFEPGSFELIPWTRFARWVSKTALAQYDETFCTALFCTKEDRCSKPIGWFVKEECKCSCSIKNQKYVCLVDIVTLQGEGAAEKIGFWAYKIDEDLGGRELGLLICGKASTTGKSTVGCALSHVVDKGMTFQPVSEGNFPWTMYKSALVKFLIMNEYRTDIANLRSSTVLRCGEHDDNLMLERKGLPPVEFVNSRSRFKPRMIMTTNYLKAQCGWQLEDIIALKNRMGVVVHFTKPLQKLRQKTPLSFKVDKPCACCSRRFWRYCVDAYLKNKKAGHAGAAHLNGDPEYMNKELIHRYNPRWAEMSGSSDSEEESPAVCKRKAKKAKR